MPGIWDQVEALVAEGKGATITLTEAHEVKIPYQRKKLPKKYVHKDRPWETYDGCTRGTGRPRCQWKGCNTYLKKDQPVACCIEHEQKIADYCIRMLAVIRYRIVDRLDDYDELLHGDSVVAKFLEELKDGTLLNVNGNSQPPSAGDEGGPEEEPTETASDSPGVEDDG